MSIRVTIAPGDRVVPWINQCAPEWQLKPLKYLVNINSKILSEQTPSDFEIDYIDINSVDSGGHQNSVETMTFGNSPSRARRIVNGGDVIVSTVRTYLKAISYIEKANDNLICSTGFAVITSGKEVHPKFLFYWVRSEWFVNEIVARSIGVSYPAINAIEIGNLPFPVINLEEQQAIADFLDRETSRIDELIAKKQRLINLLKEQRTTLINRTVTKGLNQDVPMKDSGVEWLGEIPAHWDIKKLKHVLLRNDGGVWGDDYDENGTIVLRSTEQTIGGEWCINEPAIRRINAEEYKKSKLICGDLLITKSSGSELHIGKATLVTKKIEDMNCCFSNFMQRIRLLSNYSAKYIYYVFNCILGREQLVYYSNTTTGLANLSSTIIGNIHIAMPNYSEQQAITDYLDQETSRIDDLVGRIIQAIEKLQEYRSALITAAVTGKIDVRQQVS